MAETDSAQEIAQMSFEAALEELKGIVARLESGLGKLDYAIAAYARGAALKRHCDAKLREAQEKIERITMGEDGAAKMAPLDVD